MTFEYSGKQQVEYLSFGCIRVKRDVLAPLQTRSYKECSDTATGIRQQVLCFEILSCLYNEAILKKKWMLPLLQDVYFYILEFLDCCFRGHEARADWLCRQQLPALGL